MIQDSIDRRNIEVRSSLGFGTTIPRAWPRRMMAAVGVRWMNLDDSVEPTGPDERRIEHLGSVRRADDEDERPVVDRASDQPEPADDLVTDAVLDVLRQGVHLVEQRVEALRAAAHPAHHPAEAEAHAPALAATVHPDRVELVEEDDARTALAGLRVLPGEPAALAEEAHHH